MQWGQTDYKISIAQSFDPNSFKVRHLLHGLRKGERERTGGKEGEKRRKGGREEEERRERGRERTGGRKGGREGKRR